MQVSVTRANAMLKLWEPLTVGMSKAVPVVFSFSPDWDGLSKVAVFTAGTTQIDVLDTSWASESVCFVPPEVLTTVGDRVNVGVYGTDADNAVVIPTVWVNLGRVQPAPDPSGDPTTDPTLPVWAQLQGQLIDSAEVDANGDLIITLHSGTELNAGYVVGPQGETGPQGPQGIQGVQGPAGPGVPAGGTPGQVLYKSLGDYATLWGNLPAQNAVLRMTGTIGFDNDFSSVVTGAELLDAYNEGRKLIVAQPYENGELLGTLYLQSLESVTDESGQTIYAYFSGLINDTTVAFLNVSAEPEGTVSGYYYSHPVNMVPNGGTTGQVLAKASDDDGNVEWIDPESGGGAVSSVNGQTGDVVLTASDVGAGTYSKPSGGIPKTDLASAVQTSLGKADTALQTAPVTSVNNKTGAVVLSASDVGAATKSYVDSAISQSTAFYRGNFATRAALLAVAWQTTNPEAAYYVTNNDYAVVLDDETQNDECWRYIYVTGTGWTAQYKINETPLTQAQLDALNSGATAANITQIATNTTAIAGKITAPSSPASGAFLVWNGTAWVAQTLSTWQGGSY